MMLVIGLMSGTSLDGVDAAVIDTDGETIASLGSFVTVPYDAGLRHRLRALLDRADRLAAGDPEVLGIERAVTDAYADAIARLAVRPELIGMHGQTILHRPRERRTWQLGDAPRLAALTGCRVAFDFRGADVRSGGEGAPLAPLFHAAMLPGGIERPAAVLNVGGVANLTWIGRDGALLACDTGPGNALLDDWAQRHTGIACDVDGALARAGVADEAVVAHLLEHPFFARAAPKSLDRLDFAHAMDAVSGLSAADGAATLTAFTAAAVAAACLPAPPTAWLVGGGGRHNPALMRELAVRLGAAVRPVEAVGWNGDALEAQCFGYLAARVSRGLPLSLPGTTGVSGPMPGGDIAVPAGPEPA